LPGDFGPFPVWGDTSPPPLEEYLRKSLKVAKPPMTSVVYSNMAYTLIGYLVQKFSGVPYKQYIQEHVFTPLEGETALVEAGILNAPMADLESIWRESITPTFTAFDLPMPQAIGPIS
jgi:CubicO group peptidase (beta-lactamase class C family)